jgi:hypothetical protein
LRSGSIEPDAGAPAVVADRQRIARRYAAGTSGLSGAPRPTCDQVSSWMTLAPISAMQDSRSVVRSGSRSSTASTSHGRLEESNPDCDREVDGKKQYLEEKLLRFLEKDLDEEAIQGFGQVPSGRVYQAQSVSA